MCNMSLLMQQQNLKQKVCENVSVSELTPDLHLQNSTSCTPNLFLRMYLNTTGIYVSSICMVQKKKKKNPGNEK